MLELGCGDERSVSPGCGYDAGIKNPIKHTEFRQVEADMVAAKRAGDSHGYGYDIGLALSLTLKHGLRVESTPARAQMAAPLRLLHIVDLELRRVLAPIQPRRCAAFQAESASSPRCRGHSTADRGLTHPPRTRSSKGFAM